MSIREVRTGARAPYGIPETKESDWQENKVRRFKLDKVQEANWTLEFYTGNFAASVVYTYQVSKLVDTMAAGFSILYKGTEVFRSRGESIKGRMMEEYLEKCAAEVDARADKEAPASDVTDPIGIIDRLKVLEDRPKVPSLDAFNALQRQVDSLGNEKHSHNFNTPAQYLMTSVNHAR